SRRAGGALQAVAEGLAATRSDPGRAQYWSGLGLAYVAGSRWREASAAFDQARKLAPYDIRNTGDLAAVQMILASSGDTIARMRALQLADQAIAIDANNPGAHLIRATVMQFTGNLAEALRSVERALALDPHSSD